MVRVSIILLGIRIGIRSVSDIKCYSFAHRCLICLSCFMAHFCTFSTVSVFHLLWELSYRCVLYGLTEDLCSILNNLNRGN